MSPVFGHGRLRLYLLKLLEESPRHGYEVIRLLQDRFLGVYSPSPGTIYPRLARLEEDGLVTHEVINGKKVFTLTDKGRAEINSRLDELAELEQEITESVRGIAREVQQDIRQTVRSLREGLTQMTREVRNAAQDAQRTAWRQQRAEWERQRAEWERRGREWAAEGQRWKQEWLGRIRGQSVGDGPGEPGGPGDRAGELGRMLADFVEEIRRHAAEGTVTAETLATAQDALYEAGTKIKAALRP